MALFLTLFSKFAKLEFACADQFMHVYPVIFTTVKSLNFLRGNYGLYLCTFVLLCICVGTACVWSGVWGPLGPRGRGHWVIWQGRGPQDVTSACGLGCPSAHARRLISSHFGRSELVTDRMSDSTHSLLMTRAHYHLWSVCCFHTPHTHTHTHTHTHAHIDSAHTCILSYLNDTFNSLVGDCCAAKI